MSQFSLELKWLRTFKDTVLEIDWTEESCQALLDVFKQLSPYGRHTLWRIIHGLPADSLLGAVMRNCIEPSLKEGLLRS